MMHLEHKFDLSPVSFFSVSPVSSAARRPIQVTGEVGGSITIKCPIMSTSVRKFWCRELSTGACVTIISTTPYTDESYKNRISITDRPQEGIFQIAMRSLEERDTGLYRCGTGYQNDRGTGRTLQVDLKVSNGTVSLCTAPLYPQCSIMQGYSVTDATVSL